MSGSADPLAAHPVAILAGRGNLPVEGVKRALASGRPVVVVAVVPGVAVELARLATVYREIPFQRWQDVVNCLQFSGVTSCYFLGKIEKRDALFQGACWDERGRRVMATTPLHSDDILLAAFADDLASVGVELRPQAELLADLLAPPGVWTGEELAEAERRDIAYGYRLARVVADLDVGQTVVVKDGAVVAVEAIEGTDACLLRGAQLAGAGAVAVKVAGGSQDPRFDLPTVGPDTLTILKECRYRILAVEVGRTLVLERDSLVAAARAAGVKLVGWPLPGEGAGT
ncbi:MAG: UDP-2,3-diacylglucosamine diphosphatase LpxI [Limnochordales bacterium]|nr:UDP-2,3-diacylglucosamine diphosphatase LpxI [Limnochordales bacterium]